MTCPISNNYPHVQQSPRTGEKLVRDILMLFLSAKPNMRMGIYTFFSSLSVFVIFESFQAGFSLEPHSFSQDANC